MATARQARNLVPGLLNDLVSSACTKGPRAMKNVLRVVVSGTLFLAALALPNLAAADTTDDALAEKVIDTVQRYPNFSVFDDISITVENRVVTLFGRVTKPIKKEDIEKRVAKIDGIRQLISEIKVLPVSPMDDDLRL